MGDHSRTDPGANPRHRTQFSASVHKASQGGGYGGCSPRIPDIESTGVGGSGWESEFRRSGSRSPALR